MKNVLYVGRNKSVARAVPSNVGCVLSSYVRSGIDIRNLAHWVAKPTFGLVQRIDYPTYQNGHSLDYVITRRDSDFASNFSIADKISDHMALHVSLACQRPHPERKEVYVRALRRINNDSLEADLACLNIDIECDDVNVVVAQYDTSLSRLLDKHAPLKKICIVDRPLSDWMTDDIRALQIIRRKNEVIWRRNPLCIHFEIFQESCMAVKHAIDENKTQVIQKKITESNGDQKKLFNIVNTLLGRRKQLVLPDYNNPITLASTFNMFLLIRLQTFVQSFHCLRAHYPLTRLSRWILLCLIEQFCLRVLL